MATTYYLDISTPNPNHYKIKEVPSPDQANAASTLLPKQALRKTFSHVAPASIKDEILGESITDFTWNGGPIEITGIVAPSTLGTNFELIFNDGDAGSRSIGVFCGSLKEGVKVEYFSSKGERTMRLDLEAREGGKYVWADAERGHWAKKRVVLMLGGFLPDAPGEKI